MIEVRYIEGRWCPMFICDHCHCPIETGKEDAIALWLDEEGPSDGSLTDPTVGQRPCMHVHKGRCDEKTRARLPGYALWEDIEIHISFLLTNTRFGTAGKRIHEIKERAHVSGAV